MKKFLWLTLWAAALLLIIGQLVLNRTTPENRTYLIGWDVDPPDQIATESGEPTGFAVELVREAATRRGITLKWVLHPESAEAALLSKAVDLWPMMTITEDRKKLLHLTDPYQENELGLLVVVNSAFTKAGDLKLQTISYNGIPYNRKLLREYFPGNNYLIKSSLADAVRSVCVGEAAAVLADRAPLYSLLLSGSLCPGTPLRLLDRNIKTELGVGSTREARAAADAIRDEISVMAADGRLAELISFWGYDAGQELNSFVRLQQTRSQLRWYRIGSGLVAALFLIATWLAAGYRRQRSQAQGCSRALGLAERNVRLVADSLTEMVVAYDMNGTLTYANSGTERLTGYSLAELQRAAPLAWVHPEDRHCLRMPWDNAGDGQTTGEVVFRVIAKDGAVKWTAGSWGPVTDAEGNHVGIRGTCQDITDRVAADQLIEETEQKFRTIVEEIAERKRVEQALRESEERFRTMANTAPVMIWVCGPDKGFTFLNKTWLDFTGRTTEQELGNGWVEGVHPKDMDCCLAVYSSSFDARCNFQMEYRLRRSDGEYRWVLGNGVPLYKGGEFAGYIGSCIDVTEQKLAQVKLQSSERRLNEAQRLARVGSWERHVEADAIYWSDEMFRILGLPIGSPLHFRDFLSYVHPEDREKIIEANRQARSTWEPVVVEYRITRPDGETRFIRSFIKVIVGDPHGPVRMTGATQDITEQVKAEHALRESEQRLTLAQSAAHLGVWRLDLGTHVITLSGDYTRLYGLAHDRRELTHEEWMSMIHPDDRERVRALSRETLEQTHIWDAEYRVVWQDGTLHWLLAKGTVFLDDFGRPSHSTGVVIDITERKWAEESLRESEERFRNMADTAPVMIWVCGPDKGFTFFNKTWLDFTGRTMAQELGSGWVEGLHPDDLDRCFTGFSSSFEARQDFQIECRLRRADGEYGWVLCRGVPRFNPGGIFAGYIGSDIDITEQKRAEAELRRSLNEIAHLNRVAAIGELTASLAHELNQPLAAILANAQAAGRFLNRESPDLAQIRECLTDIVADDKRAGEVIRSLRTLLKKGESQERLVDLNEVVSDVVRMMRNDALLRQVTLKFEPNPGLHPVCGDRVQLYQVVLNLIGNGLEAAAEQPNGSRWLSARTAESEGGGIQLIVEDSGRGIAESDLLRVFDPFYSTKQEGLGMGLAISQTIVKAHGGRIWAEKSAQSGAIFRCVFPAARQAAAAAS